MIADPDDWRLHDEVFNFERRSTWETFAREWREIREELEAARPFALPLAEQATQGTWKVLGFATRADFEEHLTPTMKSLTSSPGDMGEHLLELLVRGPVNLDSLEEEGVPEKVRVDLLNRLLADSWAKLDQGVVFLTPAGKALLPKRMSSWHETRA